MNVYAADGSGTMTTPTANIVNGSSNTIVFTYKAAAAGGISNGAVTLTAPAGWPAPTAGNTTSSLGARSYAGQTVTVSGVTLAANATFTITYGPATAPTTGGAQTWATTSVRRPEARSTALAASPSINIYAADGSGTLTGAPSTVGFGSAGNTQTFTYTAAAGGTSAGAVTVAVPAGWSAPSTAPGTAGYTVSSTGAVSVAGQTITVSPVTLAAGATMTITYGSGAPGATAATTAGAAAWQARSKATVGGALTNLSASPSTTVAQPPASGEHVPGRGRPLRHRLLGGRLRGSRDLRDRDRQLRQRSPEGRALDPPGRRQLLERQRVLERVTSVRHRDGNVQLVVRVPVVELPGRRRLHRADARDGQPERCRAHARSTTFTVDQTPPSAFSLTSPSAGFVGPAASVSATALDPGGSGITQLEFRYCPAQAARSLGHDDRHRRRDLGNGRAAVGPLGPDGWSAVHARRACNRRSRQHDATPHRRQ